MTERPTSATVFGILNVCFGGIGILTLPIQLLMIYGPPGSLNPLGRILKDHPGLRSWLEASIWIGGFTAIVLIAAGIGLIRLKPWGRSLSIGWGVFGVLFQLFGTVVNFLVAFPALREHGEGPGGVQERFFGLSLLVGAVISCGYILYPILMIYYLTRPAVAAAFQREAGEEPPR